jgi:hypothetical protein
VTDEPESWCDASNAEATAPMTAAAIAKAPVTIVIFAADHSRYLRPPGSG